MNTDRSSLVTIIVILLIIAAVAVFTYVRTSNTSDDEDVSAADSALKPGEDQRYTTLDGMVIDLGDFDGTVRIVNSWASWCPFCVEELPDFAALAQEYEEQGVVVIAINRKEPRRTAVNYLNTVGELDPVIFALDPSDTFYERIGGFTMPETLFYDREGNIVVHKRGFMTLAEMRQHTETALAATNQ